MMIQKHFEDIIRKKFGYDFSPTQQIAVEHFIQMCIRDRLTMIDNWIDAGAVEDEPILPAE